MKQKKVGNKLYVLDMTPYVITEDTDVDIIFVQQEKFDGYVALNPTLASKIATINYLVYSVQPKEWATEPGPEPPVEPKDPELYFTQAIITADYNDEVNILSYIHNPNNFDDYELYATLNEDQIDLNDNDYFTYDENEGILLIGTNYSYDLEFHLYRAGDEEYYEAEASASFIIYPSEAEQDQQRQDAGQPFDGETGELDINLSQDAINEMTQDEVDTLATNLLEFRNVMSWKAIYPTGEIESDDRIYFEEYEVDYDGTHTAYGIKQRQWGGYVLTIVVFGENYLIWINEEIPWVNFHKLAAVDMYALYAMNDQTYSHVIRMSITEDESVDPLSITSNKLYFPKDWGWPWEILIESGGTAAVAPLHEDNVNGWVRTWDGGDPSDPLAYHVEPFETAVQVLPTDEYNYDSILMHDATAVVGYDLTINIPQDETWMAEIKYPNSQLECRVNCQDVTNDKIWVCAGAEFEIWKNGLRNQPYNYIDAVSGITAGAINGNEFTMPANDAEITLSYVVPTNVNLEALDGSNVEIDDVTGGHYTAGDTISNGSTYLVAAASYTGTYDTTDPVSGDPTTQTITLQAHEVEWTTNVNGLAFEMSPNGSNDMWQLVATANYTFDGTETATLISRSRQYAGTKTYPICAAASGYINLAFASPYDDPDQPIEIQGADVYTTDIPMPTVSTDQQAYWGNLTFTDAYGTNYTGVIDLNQQGQPELIAFQWEEEVYNEETDQTETETKTDTSIYIEMEQTITITYHFESNDDPNVYVETTRDMTVTGATPILQVYDPNQYTDLNEITGTSPVTIDVEYYVNGPGLQEPVAAADVSWTSDDPNLHFAIDSGTGKWVATADSTIQSGSATCNYIGSDYSSVDPWNVDVNITL